MKEAKVKKEDYLKIKRQNEKNKAIIVILLFTLALMFILLGIYLLNGITNNNKNDTVSQVSNKLNVNGNRL